MKIDIPDELIKAVDNCLTRNQKNDYSSKFGALNAVAYIGEGLIAAVSTARQVPPATAETNLETARKAHQHAAHVYAGVKKGPKNETQRVQAAADLERAGIAVTLALAIAKTKDV